MGVADYTPEAQEVVAPRFSRSLVSHPAQPPAPGRRVPFSSPQVWYVITLS